MKWTEDKYTFYTIEEKIIEETAKRFKTTKEEILGRTKKRNVVVARSIVMYLMHKHTGHSSASLANIFYRDRGGVSRSIRSVKNDSSIRKDADRIENICFAETEEGKIIAVKGDQILLNFPPSANAEEARKYAYDLISASALADQNELEMSYQEKFSELGRELEAETVAMILGRHYRYDDSEHIFAPELSLALQKERDLLTKTLTFEEAIVPLANSETREIEHGTD